MESREGSAGLLNPLGAVLAFLLSPLAPVLAFILTQVVAVKSLGLWPSSILYNVIVPLVGLAAFWGVAVQFRPCGRKHIIFAFVSVVVFWFTYSFSVPIIGGITSGDHSLTPYFFEESGPAIMGLLVAYAHAYGFWPSLYALTAGMLICGVVLEKRARVLLTTDA